MFMAVAGDKVGFDRRGSKLYKRTPDRKRLSEGPNSISGAFASTGASWNSSLTRSEKDLGTQRSGHR